MLNHPKEKPAPPGAGHHTKQTKQVNENTMHTTIDKQTDIEIKRRARQWLLGETTSIQLGRSCNTAAVTWSTHVDIIDDSEEEPELHGQPYLKTHFQNGAFSKTLYTPSTMHITVGREWKGDTDE